MDRRQPATRDDPNREFAERFRLADKNQDGIITESEARAAGLWFRNDFNSVDADHSGTITLFELGTALQQRVGGSLSDFDAADTNHDGRLTEDELPRATTVTEFLTTMKRSGSSPVTRDEYESYAIERMYRDSELPSVAPNIIEKRF